MEDQLADHPRSNKKKQIKSKKGKRREKRKNLPSSLLESLTTSISDFLLGAAIDVVPRLAHTGSEG
jgi:hypothetical protein